jgi:hypothetical protein
LAFSLQKLSTPDSSIRRDHDRWLNSFGTLTRKGFVRISTRVTLHPHYKESRFASGGLLEPGSVPWPGPVPAPGASKVVMAPLKFFRESVRASQSSFRLIKRNNALDSAV